MRCVKSKFLVITLSNLILAITSYRYIPDHNGSAPGTLSGTWYAHDFHVAHSGQTAHTPLRWTAVHWIVWSALAFHGADKLGKKDVIALEIHLRIDTWEDLTTGTRVYESLCNVRWSSVEREKINYWTYTLTFVMCTTYKKSMTNHFCFSTLSGDTYR